MAEVDTHAAATPQAAAPAEGPALTPADLDRLTDRVYRMLREELLIARERRGERPQRGWR